MNVILFDSKATFIPPKLPIGIMINFLKVEPLKIVNILNYNKLLTDTVPEIRIITAA